MRRQSRFVSDALDRLLADQQANSDLKAALKYTLGAPGKHIRSALVLWSCELVSGRTNRDAEIASMAIEMVHTYSLVHDDLPAMDNDDMRRGLLLSLQLGEMGLPYTLCLNMMDEARERGIQIDKENLGEALGVPVVEAVATQKTGLDELRQRVLDEPSALPESEVAYPEPIEQAVSELMPLLPAAAIRPRALALMVLAGRDDLLVRLAKLVDEATLEAIRGIVEWTRRAFTRSVTVEITQARMRAATKLMERVMVQRESRLGSLVRWLGRATVHPVGGLVGPACCP